MLIYPAIDLLNGRCVRLRQGDYSRETVFSDDPAAVARQWVELGADRLHVVDLDGAKAGKPVNGAVVRKIVEAAGVPVQLGGGLRTDDHLAAVFDWGVRWAVLGTRALQDPGLGSRGRRHAIPDRIVLGVDAKNGYVATDGWLAVSRVKAVDLAKQVSDCAAGRGRLHRHRQRRHDERAELRRAGRDASGGSAAGHRVAAVSPRWSTCGGWWRPALPAASSAARCTKEVSICRKL